MQNPYINPSIIILSTFVVDVLSNNLKGRVPSNQRTYELFAGMLIVYNHYLGFSCYVFIDNPFSNLFKLSSVYSEV